MGAEWVGRVWEGDKPSTGIAAAARRARHGLLADAARDMGASVILMAHTRDDVGEGELMRAQGATLGRLREWSPSPVWPEGRGLMLFRPLLDESRAGLRDYLTGRSAGWIDDPANDDPRHLRARVRRAMAEGAAVESSLMAGPTTGGDVVEVEVLPLGAGFVVGRDLPAEVLAAVLLCAAGTDRPPRGDRLAGLVGRLRSGEAVSAVLAGARVETDGERVFIGREPGELKRAGDDGPLSLVPGQAQVWDGRVELGVAEEGWSVAPAAGRMSRLSPADRAVLQRLPAWARGAVPVLMRDEETAPVLAGRVGTARFLAPRRLLLAISGRRMGSETTIRGLSPEGETTQERGLLNAVHGETPTTDLFSDLKDKTTPRNKASEDRKPK